MEAPRTAIVGVGLSDRSENRTDVDYAELANEAIQRALTDAGVQLLDIDHAVTAALDFVDGRTIASMSTAEVVGSYLKPEGRLCGDGSSAVLYAWAKMRTGTYRLGLVVAHAKESQGRHEVIESAAFDPFTQRRLAPDGDVVAGLAARRFYASTGREPREAAEAVAAARRAGAAGPTSLGLPEVTADEVLDSPILASPIHALEKAVHSDGACAMVLAVEDVATGLRDDPVWIVGAGTQSASYWDDRDLASTEALAGAIDRTIGMTGWSDGPDVAEFSAQFGYQVLQFAPSFEALGGPALTPSGGWLAGGAQVLTGLDRVAACVSQLRGDAGAHQVPAANRALAHGFHGLGAQTHSVIALEGGAA